MDRKFLLSDASNPAVSVDNYALTGISYSFRYAPHKKDIYFFIDVKKIVTVIQLHFRCFSESCDDDSELISPKDALNRWENIVAM